MDGFGLFGSISEGAYRLDQDKSLQLAAQVIDYAKTREFRCKAGLNKSYSIHQTFFKVLVKAEFVGSNAGGAAGYLKLCNLPKGQNNPFVLRFALQQKNGAGNLWGLIPYEVARRHELLHFVREAESLERRNISLFEAEKYSSNVIGKIFLMLREEIYVWVRTIFW